MPRWNMIVDAGGTPPRLQEFARKPREFEDELKRTATDFDCKLLEPVWWNEFSWEVYATVEGDDQARIDDFFREVQAYGTTPILTTDEKGKRAAGSSGTTYPQQQGP